MERQLNFIRDNTYTFVKRCFVFRPSNPPNCYATVNQVFIGNSRVPKAELGSLMIRLNLTVPNQTFVFMWLHTS